MIQVLVLAGVVAATAALSLWWRARDGRVRTVADRFSAADLDRMDAPAGRRVLVEFTAPSCAPCATARRILDEAATAYPDVAVRTVDLGEHLDLARHHHVLRAPTTFLLLPDGVVAGRIGGVPDRADLTALLDAGAPRGHDRAA